MLCSGMVLSGMIFVSDVSIPQVGFGRSGNRPSGRVDSGSGNALLNIPRVNNSLVNFKVIEIGRAHV